MRKCLTKQNMIQLQGKGCKCVCTCEVRDDENRPSVVEDSCTCRSCCQLDGQPDIEETVPKQLDSRSSSESSLYRPASSQDNRPRRSRSDIFRNPGSVSSENGSFRRLHLFCTYSSDSTNHLKQVLQMLKTLKNSGFNVRLDCNRNNPNVQDMSLATNMQDWLDGNIAHADFVIACISPKYLVDIQAPTDDVPEADADGLSTRYIYDQLRAEYFTNRCHHQKVIPVRFRDSYVPNINIPPFMKTTMVYTYPSGLIDLTNFLNMNKTRL